MKCVICSCEISTGVNGKRRYCAPCMKKNLAQKSKDYRSNPKYIKLVARYTQERRAAAALHKNRTRPADKIDDYVTEVLGL